ncbi:MAG: S53 family peptidase [Sciscionella sp.]
MPMVALGVGATAANAASATTPNASAHNRVVLKHSSPTWAKPDNVAVTPYTSAQKPIDARVYLAPRHKRQLDQLAAAVSDPSSPRYRHYITPTVYRARFGPNKHQVAAVEQWLNGAGLQITGVGAGERYVVVHGSPQQAEHAFATQLKSYRHNGRTDRAPALDLSVPRDLGAAVLGVTGLNEAPHLVRPARASGDVPPARNHSASALAEAPPSPGFRNARPCSKYYGQLVAKFQGDYQTPLPKFDGHYRKYAVCGYTPAQLRGAYGVTGSKLSGSGVTVAITDAYASPTMRNDANTYATRHGDPAFRHGQYSESRPTKPFRNQQQCGPSGWYGEETLDVEAVHGMATNANVIYYASRSCVDADFIDTLARVVDDNQASIVSNSWADVEQNETVGSIRAYEAVFEQGAVQGIGFFFSSGDSGDELQATGQVQVDYPASDPYATAVGGTSLAVGASNNYLFESGWGTDLYTLSSSGTKWDPRDPLFDYGAGGGFSTLFPRPAYQRGVVPASSPAGRAVPDIAMDADPTTGMLVGQTQTFPSGVQYGEYRIGGTSLASPLMAGMQALASQQAGGRLGFANPAIYRLAAGNSAAFHDVTGKNDGRANVRPDFVNGVDGSAGTHYSIRTFGDDSSLSTKKGWDDVTGVGTPDKAYFTAASAH